MIQSVLHFTRGRAQAILPDAWEAEILAAGLKILRASTLSEAAALLGHYPILAIVTDLLPEEPRPEAAIRVLAEAAADPATPILLFGSAAPPPALQPPLAESGVTHFLESGFPARMFMHPILTRRALLGVAPGNGNGTTPTTPGFGEEPEARRLIHDLSQPLAAIQGRLEILALRAPEGDPLKETYGKLIRLSTEAGQTLQRLRELHRGRTVAR